MTSNRPGFRVPPQPSKKEAIQQLQTELANVQMAGRISQMMTQQLMQSVKTMSDDLGSTLQQLYDLQYKFGAIQKVLKLDATELNKLANDQRLVDFDEAAVKQDTKDNLVLSDVVMADSTVTITSTASDASGADVGIFRSRIKLSESGVPDLISGLAGKKVGDKVTVKLNDVMHEVELLAIRNPTLQAETSPSTEATH